MPSFEQLESTFASDPQRRGTEFEAVVGWWLGADPLYRSLLSRVWRWRDWPDRDGPDVGIDLVAEAVDGGLWAIQAKCTREDLQVKKSEVDSFLSAASDPRFSSRLLVTSAGRVSPNLRRVLERLGALLVHRGHLLDSSVDWPATPSDLSSGATPQVLPPQPHQLEAIDAVAAGFETVDRGQLVMACGTGKTGSSDLRVV